MKELDSIELIAEFMGIHIDPIKKVGSLEFVGYLITDEDGEFDIKEPKCYSPQTDYNQLMPVLERLEKEGCVVQISYCIITTCYITAFNKKHLPPVNFQNDNNGGKPSIEAIYKTVVEYLTWRANEIKPPEPLPTTNLKNNHP